MNINLARLALLALPTLMPLNLLDAQSQRDTILVQAGALRFVDARVNGHRTIGIDTTAQFSPTWSASLHTLRDAVAGASVAARIGQASDFVKCENPRERKTCTLNGVDAVVELAHIVFRADSAAVRLRLKERENSEYQIAVREFVVILVKNGPTWKYVAARRTTQS